MLSASFWKKLSSEISQAVFVSTVSKVAPAPQPAMKFRATFSSEVQLDTPHQMIFEPTLYWSNKSTPTPLQSVTCLCGKRPQDSKSSLRYGKYLLTIFRSSSP